jgi:hypothetical protein
MTTSSTAAQIATAVKATLEGYDLTQISQQPTIVTVKKFTVGLSQMATAVKSNRARGEYCHMHLVLDKKEYPIATGDSTAVVYQIKKPEEVNPVFQTEKKEDLTCEVTCTLILTLPFCYRLKSIIPEISSRNVKQMTFKYLCKKISFLVKYSQIDLCVSRHTSGATHVNPTFTHQ